MSFVAVVAMRNSVAAVANLHDYCSLLDDDGGDDADGGGDCGGGGCCCWLGEEN